MHTVKAARTALERQVWESVQIHRILTRGDTCLNLKTEWGSSNTPLLENKARPSATHSQPKSEGQGQGGRKRGEYKEEGRRASQHYQLKGGTRTKVGSRDLEKMKVQERFQIRQDQERKRSQGLKLGPAPQL